MDSEAELAAFEPINKRAREAGVVEHPDAPTFREQHRQEQFRQDYQQQQQQRQEQQQRQQQQQQQQQPAAAAAAGDGGDAVMEEAAVADGPVEFTPGGLIGERDVGEGGFGGVREGGGWTRGGGVGGEDFVCVCVCVCVCLGGGDRQHLADGPVAFTPGGVIRGGGEGRGLLRQVRGWDEGAEQEEGESC